uniref:Pre-mRNA-splicing factor 3 n=1 Tax=Caenorhabditis tropicalis TaxID=1561998 RepID=A0A1I7TMF2_9PELO
MGKLEDICDRYLNKRDERKKVIEAVERCLKKGYDFEKLRDRVNDAVRDTHEATKVISAVCDHYPQLRKRTRNDRDEDRDRDRKRDKTDSRNDDRRDRGKEKERESSRRMEAEIANGGRPAFETRTTEEQKMTTSTAIEETLRAKELMYQAQQQIEERKMKMAVASGAVPPKAALIQSSTQAVAGSKTLSLANLSRAPIVAKLDAMVANSQVGVMAPLPEAVQQAEKKVQQQITKEAKEPEKLIEYLDPRISAKTADRRRRGFNFHEKGEFEKLANKQRAMAKLERLQNEVSSAAQSTGISSAVKLAMVTPTGTAKIENGVPDIEWWDMLVLDKVNYDEIPPEDDSERYSQTVSELVEHPISMRAPTEPLTQQYLKVYLTTKEKKKIRRQNRKEVLKEKTEKIRLGLEKAPEPKVKISNLMRVLGNDAIQDPTKMEAHVRKQMAERLKKHETLNAERKLTEDQKRAKKTKKLSEDTSTAVNVAVYRVKSLAHPSKKFKVETNAKQLQMSGAIMMHKAQNVIVVEGGPKQQKFYKNLMLNRIKWADEIIGQKKDAEKDAPGERNLCEMIWEGQVKRRNFRDFTVHTATLEKQAREFFEKHGVAQYWDLCYSTTVLLEGQDILPTA